MSALRVVLADDHALVRAGIRKLLETMPDVEVVGEADDGARALELVRALRPDLVLMDVSMKHSNGIETTAQLKKEFPDVRVIIVSMHATEEHVTRALRVGASGYLLKDAAAVELGLALEAVRRGETYLSPRVSKRVVDHFVERPAAGETAELTERQREILRLIAEGHATKEIAHLLRISVKTVETHRTHLMQRLDIHDVAGLVRYAIRNGLISADR